MSGLFGNKRSSRRSVALTLPVFPVDEDTAGTHLGYQHKEGVAWVQNVERNSRVHLNLCITADGEVYVERVSVTGVLNEEEPGAEAGHGGERADTPLGGTVSPLDVTPDRTGAFSQSGNDDSGDHGDGDVLPHTSEASVWDAYLGTFLVLPTGIRLELRVFGSPVRSDIEALLPPTTPVDSASPHAGSAGVSFVGGAA